MRKTELVVLGETIHPKTKASIVSHEHTNIEDALDQQNRVSSTITQSTSMSQVGLGDDVDLSFCVEDGFYESATLYGKTMVNCIQEPSEPSYVALGENLEFQNKKVEHTTDGQIKSAMLKGQTLVNISKPAIGNGNTVSTYANIGMTYYQPKSNTKYFCYIENLTNDTFTYYLNNITFNLPTAELQRFTIEPNSIVTKIATTVENPDKNGLWLSVSSLNEATEKQNLRIMLIEYQEGMENWDIPYFQGMQSVTMSTELENVCSRYNSSVAKNGKTFTVGESSNRQLNLSSASDIANYNFKPNTKYLMQFKISNLNLDGLSSVALVFSNGAISTGDSLFGDFTNCTVKVKQNGIYRIVLTTSSIVSTSRFVIKGYGSEWEETSSTSRKLTISNIMCIEYQNGMENWDLPYFETTQLMKPTIIHSGNKNLINLNDVLIGKTIHPNNGNLETNELRQVSGLIRVKPNTTYVVSQDYATTKLQIFIHQYSDKRISSECAVAWERDKVVANINQDMAKYYVWAKEYAVFTTSSTTKYIAIRTQNGMTISGSKIQVEEAGVASNYITSNVQRISALEPITLRAIGNVKDTLDLSTGEYVQRIGEIVLDGSDDEIWYPSGLNQDLIDAGRKNLVFYYNHKNNGTLANLKLSPYSEMSNIISDKLAQIAHEQQVATNTTYDFPSITGGISVPELRIAIPVENSAAQQDSATCKAWLKENPIKVQYELANPITRKISLEYPNLQTYQDITHVHSIAMDGTLIPNIYLPSDIAYKTLLKPNTKYNVIVDREVIDSTNQLTVNLGGATATTTVGNRITTITTPSTLSNELLTMSGRGNKLSHVMVIEGDVVGDEPYFEGICDCKSPILSNVGKNLFNPQKIVYPTNVTNLSIEGNCVYIADGTLNGWREIQIAASLPIGTYYVDILENGNFISERNKIWVRGVGSTMLANVSNRNIFTISEPATRIDLVIQNANNLTFNNTQYSIHIEKANTAPLVHSPHESYKSNILSANGDKIELTRDMIEQGGYDGNPSLTYEQSKLSNDKRLRVKTYIKVKSNTTYRITSSVFKFNHREYLSNGFTNGVKSEWTNELLFTTQATTQYITLLLKDANNDNKVLTTNLFNDDDVVIREVDKTIVLRSLPNGVCDTLNVETGEYVQNIMEFTVGKEDSKWYAITEYDKTLSAQIDVPSELRNMFYKNASPIVCDKFPWLSASQDTEHVRFSTPADVEYSNTIIVWINKTKLSSYTANGINDYIKSVGGITVQGRLLSPIVKTVDLEGYPFAYKDGHVILSSGSVEPSLTPKNKYVIQTNRAGTIQSNQDRLLNHDKRLAILEEMILKQLVHHEYNRAKGVFLSQTRQIIEGGIQMHHTKYDLLAEFIEKKLYRSLDEIFEMLDVYFMLGDITDGEYDALYEALMPSAEEFIEVEEAFDGEDAEA